MSYNNNYNLYKRYGNLHYTDVGFNETVKDLKTFCEGKKYFFFIKSMIDVTSKNNYGSKMLFYQDDWGLYLKIVKDQLRGSISTLRLFYNDLL